MTKSKAVAFWLMNITLIRLVIALISFLFIIYFLSTRFKTNFDNHGILEITRYEVVCGIKITLWGIVVIFALVINIITAWLFFNNILFRKYIAIK